MSKRARPNQPASNQPVHKKYWGVGAIGALLTTFCCLAALFCCLAALAAMVIARTTHTTPALAPTAPTPTPTTPAAPAVQPPTPAAEPIATLALTATAAVQSSPPPYPLTGQRYQAWINESPDTSGQYDAVWEANGWLHQPNLPPEGKRTAFSISITLEPGHYTFSGVSCDFYLDTERTGKGAVGKPTVGRGNNLPFIVETKDGGQAWGVVICNDKTRNDVVGFSMQYQGPLP